VTIDHLDDVGAREQLLDESLRDHAEMEDARRTVQESPSLSAGRWHIAFPRA
jgi:hypothetical protein